VKTGVQECCDNLETGFRRDDRLLSVLKNRKTPFDRLRANGMGLTMNLLRHNVPAVIGVTKNAFSVHFARSFDIKTTTVHPEPVEGYFLNVR